MKPKPNKDEGDREHLKARRLKKLARQNLIRKKLSQGVGR
jgi:hypothetical protein